MTNTVGPMIKKARAGAGLTQEQLAMKVTGLSASDISRAERGELIPTQEQLKTIAKVTGVTQKSLLDAAKESKTENNSSGTSGSTGSGKKPANSTSGKKPADSTVTGNGKKPAGGTSSGSDKKPTGSTSTGTNTGKTMEVTATERKLVELYRKASTDEKKTVMSILKGEKDTTNEMISSLLDGSKKPADIVSSILGSAVESFAKKK